MAKLQFPFRKSFESEFTTFTSNGKGNLTSKRKIIKNSYIQSFQVQLVQYSQQELPVIFRGNSV